MRKKIIITVVATAWMTSVAPAQIVSATLDVLDGSDPGAPTPPGIIVLDGFVDVATTDAWTAAGVFCDTWNGATLRYADGDANIPGTQPQLVNPGASNDRFVTMISRPRPRDDVSRFDNGAAAVAGGYIGPPPGQQTLRNLNIAYFASPPVGVGSPSVDGYVLRLAFEAPGQTANSVRLTNSITAPDGLHTVLLASVDLPASAGTGWVNASFRSPNPIGMDWYLWGIPEPAGGVALAALIAATIRRRRR